VFACGAGFPLGFAPFQTPLFVFFGVAGNEDYNRIELKRLDKALDSFPIPHRLVTFEGGHTWAPKEFCTEAIEWMEIQAMRAGKKEKDEKLIAELMAKGIERARGSEESKRIYDAYLGYRALAADFKGLRNVADYENKANQFKSSKEVEAHLDQEKEQDQKQREEMSEFLSRHQQLKVSDNRAVALRSLKNLVTEWRKKSDEKEATSDRIVARRLLAQFFVFLSEDAAMSRQEKNYEQAALNLTLAAELRPDNSQVLYRLADVYALGGKKKQALEALKLAIEKGFNDLTEIERNQNLNLLRGEAEYKQLIETVKQKR
jgi:tetratricopeptide (TPR) repeat protein